MSAEGEEQPDEGRLKFCLFQSDANLGSPAKNGATEALSPSPPGRRSPTKATGGAAPPPVGLIPPFKTRVKTTESLPLDWTHQPPKTLHDFKERSLSLELRKKARTEAMKNRSVSVDYRHLCARSSSQIANNYLPESLKNLVDADDAAAGRSGAEDLESSSSEGDVVSRTTFSMAAPRGGGGAGRSLSASAPRKDAASR